MIELEIQKGHFIFRDKHTAFRLWVDQYRSSYPQLPELDYVYQLCQDIGLPGPETIDRMLRIFHIRRLLKVKHLAVVPIVAGWVGSRGSGKSAGAAGAIILDGLLAGKQVWSNMAVECKVKYREAEKIFTTVELEKEALLDIRNLERMQKNGMVYIDETNIELDESRRAMSNVSLFFSYVLQEVRKLKLDVLFSTQNEMWTGDRTRYQTTFFIQCSDNAFQDGPWPKAETLGRKSHWTLFDTSGMVTGKVGKDSRECVFSELDFWNWPFWLAYDTNQLQGTKPVDLKGYERDRNKLKADPGVLKKLEEQYGLISGAIWDIVNANLEQIYKKDLWELLHITPEDRSMQTRIGTALTSLGCETKKGTTGDYYMLPDKTELIRRLELQGITVKEDKHNGNGAK